MSITDELREWAKALTHWWYDPVKDQYTYTTTDTMPSSIDAIRLDSSILAIADLIDAEHQKALDEWKAKHGQMWLKGYSECHAELLEGNETLASDLERCGWIRLPKDADGEYINIGDVMESKGSNLLFGESSFEVRSMRCDECGWEVYDRLGDRYAPSLLRHHHAPTVEDVLREFANEVYADADNEIRDRDFLCAKYAKRLTLAEVEDA